MAPKNKILWKGKLGLSNQNTPKGDDKSDQLWYDNYKEEQLKTIEFVAERIEDLKYFQSFSNDAAYQSQLLLTYNSTLTPHSIQSHGDPHIISFHGVEVGGVTLVAALTVNLWALALRPDIEEYYFSLFFDRLSQTLREQYS